VLLELSLSLSLIGENWVQSSLALEMWGANAVFSSRLLGIDTNAAAVSK
jgi:hypothetical protein